MIAKAVIEAASKARDEVQAFFAAETAAASVTKKIHFFNNNAWHTHLVEITREGRVFYVEFDGGPRLIEYTHYRGMSDWKFAR